MIQLAMINALIHISTKCCGSSEKEKKKKLGKFRSFTKETKTKQGLDSLCEFSKQERGEWSSRQRERYVQRLRGMKKSD